MDDGLGEAMRKNFKAALVIFSPPAACTGLYLVMTTLPSYTGQRAMLILLVNYVISNITLSLMLNTMAGKKFSALWQPVIGLLLVPLVAYHGLGVSSETEMLLTQLMTVAAFVYFYGRMSIISFQWCDYADTPFFYIERSKRL